MLYTLGQNRQAPAFLGNLNSRHVPAAGIHVSALVMVLGVALNYLVPEEAFSWITSVAVTGALWTWIVIMLAHLKYRRAVAEGRATAVPYRMPGAPVANWLVILFLLGVTVGLAFDPGTRVALYVAPIWVALLGIGYLSTRR
jgi:AAT family amino acid transporter/D-serine/D-alanine/glycine transporter